MSELISSLEAKRVVPLVQSDDPKTALKISEAYMGLRTVKLFPASLVGGPKILKALSSVFRDVRFMPTGGVGPANLHEYARPRC